MTYYFKTMCIILIVSICSVQSNPINAINDPRRQQTGLKDSTCGSKKMIKCNTDTRKVTDNDKKIIMVATGVIVIVTIGIVVLIYNSVGNMSFPKVTDN